LRKEVAIAISLAAMTVFNACGDKEEGGTDGAGGTTGTTDDPIGSNPSIIQASNLTGISAQIATVRIEPRAWWAGLIAQAPYQNNGFTLNLPATLTDDQMTLITEEDDVNGFIISDEDAKILSFEYINGYDANDEMIGEFYLEKENNPCYYVYWIYVDRDVTVTGEYTEVYGDDELDCKFQANLNLTKGWNIAYDTYLWGAETGKGYDENIFTTQKPAGANYAWTFYDYSDYRLAKAKNGYHSKRLKNNQ
jgi:hypothetical protein